MEVGPDGVSGSNVQGLVVEADSIDHAPVPILCRSKVANIVMEGLGKVVFVPRHHAQVKSNVTEIEIMEIPKNFPKMIFRF